METATYSLPRNAKAAALKMVARGASPSDHFEIIPAEGGRFAIKWETPLTSPEAADPEPAGDAFCVLAIQGDNFVGPHTKPAAETDAPTVKSSTRLAKIIDLLKRPEGATVSEIQAVTGWLPHTTRAFLSVQVKRKAGVEIASEKVEGRGRVYRVALRGSAR